MSSDGRVTHLMHKLPAANWAAADTLCDRSIAEVACPARQRLNGVRIAQRRKRMSPTVRSRNSVSRLRIDDGIGHA